MKGKETAMSNLPYVICGALALVAVHFAVSRLVLNMTKSGTRRNLG